MRVIRLQSGTIVTGLVVAVTIAAGLTGTGAPARTATQINSWRQPDRVLSLAFAPDGQLLATGDDQSTVRLWDVAIGTARRTLPAVTGTPDHVWQLAFAPDGRSLAALVGDGIYLWPTAGGAARRLAARNGGRMSRAFAFAPDGRTLATVTYDEDNRQNALALWNMRTLNVRSTRAWRGEVVTSVAFAPDGRIVVTADRDNTLRTWNGATEAAAEILPARGSQLAFSPRGEVAATLIGSGGDAPPAPRLRLWRVPTWQAGADLRDGNAGAATATIAYNMAFSPAGHLIAGVTEKAVNLWNTDTGALQQSIPISGGEPSAVAFAPDGNRLATGTYGGAITLWHVD